MYVEKKSKRIIKLNCWQLHFLVSKHVEAIFVKQINNFSVETRQISLTLMSAAVRSLKGKEINIFKGASGQGILAKEKWVLFSFRQTSQLIPPRKDLTFLKTKMYQKIR